MTEAQKRALAIIRDNLTTFQTKLQEDYDKKSESWQDSDAGCDTQAAIDDIESALDILNNLC